MSGKTDVVEGRLKEVAGALTGNDAPCTEGKTDQARSSKSPPKAVDKVEELSPRGMPRGKPARSNDEPCTEGKTDQAIGKVKQVAAKAVDKVEELSPRGMPRGKPARSNDEPCTERQTRGGEEARRPS